MASAAYLSAKSLLATDALGWGNPASVFKALLVTGAYTYSYAHSTVADVVSWEVVGGGYSRILVEGRSVVANPGSDTVALRANNSFFGNLSGVTVGGLIIYKQVGGDDSTPSNDPLVVFVDFPDSSPVGQDLQIEYDSGGLLVLTSP